MNVNEYKESVERQLSQGALREALRLLEVMLPAGASALRREVSDISDDYDRLIDYAMTGNPDPGRPAQLQALHQRVFTVLDLIVREHEVADTPTLYYNTVRTERLRVHDSIPSLLDHVLKTAANASAFALAGLGQEEARRRRLAAEEAERRLFERIWITVPLQPDDVAAVRNIILTDALPRRVAMIALGALTLGALQFYSEKALLLLLQAAAPTGRDDIEARATVGAVLVMAQWPKRSDSAAVRSALQALRAGLSWRSDVEEVILQLIRTADVEKISRAMANEIIPEMMKLRPDIVAGDESAAEINPEWEEMLEKSGISDKLRKLSQMQAEGGDMFYSSFSMLKSFPFFTHPSAWFLPFEAERSDVAQAVGHDLTIAEMTAMAPAMCDSDKYSFILAFNHIPAAQRQALVSRIEQSGIDIVAMNGGAEMDLAAKRRNLIVGYIQDLYRFFNLFRRKGEFPNPFTHLINPARIAALAPDFSSDDKVRLLGEFFFKHRHWHEALALFEKLPPDPSVMQKTGHAYSRLYMPQEAANALAHADALQPDNEWTLRHLGRELAASGQMAQAFDAYRRLDALHPDDLDTALAMGRCQLAMGNYREALHYFYMAEFADESSLLPLRNIGHAALLNHDFDTTEKYYARVMASETPVKEDYIDMGHLELIKNNVREALNYYRLASDTPDDMRAILRNQAQLLADLGVDATLLPLLPDFRG